jgi:hypothetical protein
MTDVRRLLDASRDLLQRPDPATAGIWPRASALLAREALENALDDYWRRHVPGLEQCSMRAQLLCLPAYLCDGGADRLAARTGYAWIRLSRACHQHVYELPPTATELGAWIDIVDEFVSAACFGLSSPAKPGKAARNLKRK